VDLNIAGQIKMSRDTSSLRFPGQWILLNDLGADAPPGFIVMGLSGD